LWDRRDRTLKLARDRIGIKPLYYSDQPAGFAFASELKALLPCAGLDFTLDLGALHDFMSFGHIRSPRSIYREVRTLPPGHVMTVAADGEPVLRRYWQARYQPAERLSEAAWVDRFRQVWLETVKGQMLADVDLGAFLSGGVDSSAVVAAMQQLSDRPVKTFTVGFPEPRYDESAHAEAVARHLGCDHHVQILDLAKARDVLPIVQRCYDEPFADSSAVPMWYISRMAAQHVKVMLSGDGGDEVFFGYKRHLTERQVGRLPTPVRHAARGFAALPMAGDRVQRWQRTAHSAGLPSGVARFFAKTQISSPALRRALFAGTPLDGRDGIGAVAALAAAEVPDPQALSRDTVEQFALCDLMFNLPGKMLTKVDRASMAHSLEVRVPMLGNAIVDLALSMPAEIKLKRNVGKYVVRQAIAPWLPAGILDRRKQGFKIPMDQWFAGDLNDHVRELWHDGGLLRSGLFNPAAVDRVMIEQRTGRRDHGRLMYAMAMLGHWWADAEDRRRAAVRG
jgi:asparagine synthase (glutamine-hydrolysing)